MWNESNNARYIVAVKFLCTAISIVIGSKISVDFRLNHRTLKVPDQKQFKRKQRESARETHARIIQNVIIINWRNILL